MKSRNPKLLILVGPPGSGKSSYAKYHLRTEDNWTRVSRDDFRAMQFQGTLATNKIETMINTAVDASIEAYLTNKTNVIIDATHCKKEYITQFVNKFSHLADIHFKVFEVSKEDLEERCKERETNTGKHIPVTVIHKMSQQLEHLKTIFDFAPIFKKEKPQIRFDKSIDKPTCYLVDLDGTVADANGRNMFNPTNEEVMADIPILPVIKVIQSLALSHKIIFVSGREDSTREGTTRWIRKYIFNDETYEITLLMRPQGNYQRDSIIKREILDRDILPYYNVIGVFDDRLQVVRECWNEAGIFCFNVNQYLEKF
jgi:predicted kinase